MNINAPSLAFKRSYVCLSGENALRHPDLGTTSPDARGSICISPGEPDDALRVSAKLCERKVPHIVIHKFDNHPTSDPIELMEAYTEEERQVLDIADEALENL
jgi:hypothetical protein